MGATTRDLFGAAAGAEPATPGSYGEVPRGYRLPATTRLGPVRLQVSDLERSLAFYDGVLGLGTLALDAGRAILGVPGAAGRGDAPLVELVERPGVRPMAPHGRLGLYHVAILLPDRPALGRFVRHLAERGVRAGAGDHLVSEAFYLADPDGLGIEVYADRPRSTWRRVGRELMMATDPVDVADLVRAAGDVPWIRMPAGTVIGHVHLHVGDLEAAAAFYADGLGFDRLVWSYSGALFLGAGGYHHHLGTNTWAGPGARPSEAGDARLLEWTVELPDTASVAAAGRSLAAGGFPVEQTLNDTPNDVTGSALVARDPWGTRLRLRAATPAVAGPRIAPEAGAASEEG